MVPKDKVRKQILELLKQRYKDAERDLYIILIDPTVFNPFVDLMHQRLNEFDIMAGLKHMQLSWRECVAFLWQGISIFEKQIKAERTKEFKD